MKKKTRSYWFLVWFIQDVAMLSRNTNLYYLGYIYIISKSQLLLKWCIIGEGGGEGLGPSKWKTLEWFHFNCALGLQVHGIIILSVVWVVTVRLSQSHHTCKIHGVKNINNTELAGIGFALITTFHDNLHACSCIKCMNVVLGLLHDKVHV